MITFKRSKKTELRLAHQQQLLATNFKTMAKTGLKIARKELFLELRSFKSNSLKNFMYDLNQILQTIQLDADFEVVFELLRQHEYCLSNLCYSLPIFTIIDETTIQINVQTSQQSLAKAIYVSCTVMPNQRSSVYSHQIAIIDDKKKYCIFLTTIL